MCLVLYLGSDANLPLIAPQDPLEIDYTDPLWPSKVLAFSVQELAGDEKPVAAHFSCRLVRYVGSFEGCGCGFNACHRYEWEEPVVPDTRALAGRSSRGLLRDYVEKHQVRELYGCWSGDEALDSVECLDITSDQLTHWSFKIPERTLLRIMRH